MSYTRRGRATRWPGSSTVRAAVVNAEWERSTGLPRALLASEGVEYQITGRLAFDVSGQQITGAGNPSDHQIAFGITLSLGQLH
jgi:hypothetical protein